MKLCRLIAMLFMGTMVTSTVSATMSAFSTNNITANIEIAVSNSSTDILDDTANEDILYGTLKMNDQNIQIDIAQETIQYHLVGKLYPFTEGKYAGSKLVGEFKSTSETDNVIVTTVQINMLKQNAEVKIVLTDQKAFTVYGKISKDDFEKFYTAALENMEMFLADEDVTRLDYLDKIVQLDIGESAFSSKSSTAGNDPQQQQNPLAVCQRVLLLRRKFAFCDCYE